MKCADILIKTNTIFLGISNNLFSGSIAVAGNKIIAIGKEHENDYLIEDKTKVFEYRDALVLPGFNDSHVHLLNACAAYNNGDFVDLSACKSERECKQKVEAFIIANPNCTSVIGGGWNYCQWDNGKLPSMCSLDEVAPDRFVCLRSWDYHTVWVNSFTLKSCDIDKGSIPENDSGIGIFSDGEPNGLLFEERGISLVADVIKGFDEPVCKETLVQYLGKIASLGITSVGDVFPGNNDAFAMYKELENEGRLSVRIHYYCELQKDLTMAKAIRAMKTSDKLRFCGLKFLTDGVAESHTAFMLDSYADNTSTAGSLLVDEAVLKDMVINADKNNFAVRLHTIGDAAVRTCLDIFEAAREKNGKNNVRHTLEHVENIQPSSLHTLHPHYFDISIHV